MNLWMGCNLPWEMVISRFHLNQIRMMSSNRNIWKYESKSRKVERGKRNEHARYRFQGTCC